MTNCIAILQSGTNKGKQCPNKASYGSYCGRHVPKPQQSSPSSSNVSSPVAPNGNKADTLIPTTEERKTNAEITTPPSLRKAMLDTLPTDFWTEPRKVMEPTCGKGGFLLDVFSRFFDGLSEKYPDIIERRKIILSNLWFCDINTANIDTCKKLLDPNNEFTLNAFVGDTLKMTFDTTFDLVVANPPYQINPTGKSSISIYHLFVEKFIPLSQLVLFVIPSRWFVVGESLDKFRSMMLSRTDIRLITHIDNACEWFGNNIELKGGCCYFLIDKTYNGYCLFNDTSYNLAKYESIIKPEFHSLVDKVLSLEVPNLSSIMNIAGFFKYQTNDTRLSDSGTTRCYVSMIKAKDRIKHVSDFVPNENNTFWKTITPEASFGAYSGFGAIFIGKPDEIHTNSYISFKVGSEDEAKSLESYLKTNFANKMLSIRKTSQHITMDTCKWIPLVPLDRIWDNQSVKEFLGIDIDIETIVPTTPDNEEETISSQEEASSPVGSPPPLERIARKWDPITQRVVQGDCLEIMKTLDDKTAQIVICDPPYNIGKDFGNNSDRQGEDEYLVWCDKWIAEGLRVLKDNGTMFIYGFSETLALILARVPREINRRWIVWHYTNKVVPGLNFWQRTHESVLVLWKNEYVFNRDSVREPYTDEHLAHVGSERPATKGRFSKGDKITHYTAHPNGALPRDVIKIPTLAGGGGTERFKLESNGEQISHPTQKPLSLTEKLLLSAKQSDGFVLIPFGGSGSEAVVCRDMGLPFVCIELNTTYIQMIESRLK
jgi:site-specific DNA-methyltransferase (adenine-specific)